MKLRLGILFIMPARNSQPAVVYIQKGFAKGESGDFKTAIAFYNKAIEMDPVNGEAYYYRGIAKKEIDDRSGAKADFKKAVTFYNKAIETDPKNAITYLGRGNAEYELANYSKAVEDYSKTIEIDSSIAVAYFNRALTAFILGEKYNCCADLQKAGGMGYNTSDYEKIFCKKE